MQIGNLFGSYERNMTENVRMENIKTETMAKLYADISGLKEGSVFNGQIMDISGEKVMVLLDNQMKLSARMQGDVPLTVGDQLLFTVKENNQSQILIKPVFESLHSAKTQVLNQALDMAGLSATEKNFQVAKELMDAGMPLDRGSLTKVLSQSMKFPETEPKTLVALNKMNLPITEETITQYERYVALDHQLSSDLDNLIKDITNFPKYMPEQTTGEQTVTMLKEMLSVFDESFQAESEQSIVSTSIENAEEPTMEGPRIFENEVVLKELSTKLELDNTDTSNLLKQLFTLKLPDENVAQIVKDSKTPIEFVDKVLSQIPKEVLGSNDIKEFIHSEPFQKLIHQIIQKSWSIEPQKMESPKEIDEMYERIQRQSERLQHVISQNGGETKDFQQSFQNMRQNMSFMEQLNEQMIYAQIPLKLSNQNTNSELYVYADKRKLMEKKDGISVMLHLDMEHLGQTDIKVTLTGKNVHARFYIGDGESVELLNNHMNELSKQLKVRGFDLTNEVVQRNPSESTNKVVEEIIDENAEKSIKRFTFDART